MYVLRTILLLLAWLSYQLPNVEQPKTKNPNQQSDSQKPESPQKGTAGKSQIPEAQKQKDATKPEDIAEKRLYHRYMRATIYGVVISLLILTGLVIQTVLTVKAVKASERSADALVSAERAWVLTHLVWTNHPGGCFPYTDHAGDQHTLVNVTLNCSNYGNTPAVITERHIKLEVTNSVKRQPDLAGAEPSFAIEPVARSQQPRPWVIDRLSGKGVAAGNMGFATFIYGVVKYRDVFSRAADGTWIDRETWFGYMVKPDNTLERIAHPEYNKFT